MPPTTGSVVFSPPAKLLWLAVHGLREAWMKLSSPGGGKDFEVVEQSDELEDTPDSRVFTELQADARASSASRAVCLHQVVKERGVEKGGIAEVDDDNRVVCHQRLKQRVGPVACSQIVIAHKARDHRVTVLDNFYR